MLLCWSSFLQAQLDFTADVVKGCAPLVVSFSSTAPGAISWSWNLGNGSSSLAQPSILYNTPGIYDVTLVVTYADGSQDTLRKSQFIEVYAIPTADFVASQLTVCKGDSLQFTSTSAGGSSSIVSWLWDLGNGDISTLSNPRQAYNAPGIYPVSLSVTDANGCQDARTRTSYINVEAPNPAFTADTTLACGPPLSTQFTPLQVSGTHFWDFGDGTTSTQASPTHVYQQTGNMSVMHVVIDANGCTDSMVMPNFVNIGVNTLSLSASDSVICLGDSMFFNTNANFNGTILWDLGDSTYSTLLNPAHLYTQPGTYYITGTISDVSGCIITQNFTVEVFQYPKVDFGVLDTTLGCDTPFVVDLVAHNPGIPGPFTYEWKIEKTRIITTNPVVRHVLPNFGYNSVVLKIVAPGGCTRDKGKARYLKVIPNELGFTANGFGG
ncbi:MAG: PKD domain-containing protein, partial [Bacteroidota bacterium]